MKPYVIGSTLSMILCQELDDLLLPIYLQHFCLLSMTKNQRVATNLGSFLLCVCLLPFINVDLCCPIKYFVSLFLGNLPLFLYSFFGILALFIYFVTVCAFFRTYQLLCLFDCGPPPGCGHANFIIPCTETGPLCFVVPLCTLLPMEYC